MTIPDRSFFQRSNVTKVAADLLGKMLISDIGGQRTVGIIVETEAYSWKERGCHAYQNQMTPRNSTMFREGGILYVYLCYGIHSMLNIVTGKEGEAEAVLIRALEPVKGMQVMMGRMKVNNEKRITSGPGKLTKALGITTAYDQTDLFGKKSILRVEDGGLNISKKKIITAPRIGIQFAGEDALLPWRFYLKDNPWVSII